jgi:hypothetical protein
MSNKESKFGPLIASVYKSCFPYKTRDIIIPALEGGRRANVRSLLGKQSRPKNIRLNEEKKKKMKKKKNFWVGEESAARRLKETQEREGRGGGVKSRGVDSPSRRLGSLVQTIVPAKTPATSAQLTWCRCACCCALRPLGGAGPPAGPHDGGGGLQARRL